MRFGFSVKMGKKQNKTKPSSMEFHNTEIWRHSSELLIHENASWQTTFFAWMFSEFQTKYNYRPACFYWNVPSSREGNFINRTFITRLKNKKILPPDRQIPEAPCKICAAAGSFPSFYLSYLAASCAKIIQICSNLQQIQNKISRGRVARGSPLLQSNPKKTTWTAGRWWVGGWLL